MFIIRFQGGLGNQMFQYAFFRAMQHLYPNIKIKADLTAYRSYKYHHGYEIEKIFGIKLNEATRKDIMRLSNYVPVWNKYKFLFKIKEKVASKFRNYSLKDSYLIQKNSLEFKKEFFQLDPLKNYYLEGFWCNDKYFNFIQTLIIDELQFKGVMDTVTVRNLKMINETESVSIHVRRGDYVKSSFDMVTLDYYKRAMKIILEKVESPVFYVFSDDVEYVEKEFGFLVNKKIIRDNRSGKSYIDMFLMSQCRHNIIANSTFSYWGAYLNRNLNKVVIAPKIFTKIQTNSLACDSWIKIEN